MMANMCEALGVLPHSGGLLDQNPYLVRGLEMVLQARAERYDREHPTKKK